MPLHFWNMIDIQVKLLRGPVYFVNETIQCLISLQNVPTETSETDNGPSNETSKTSKSLVELLCWANVQLHCFCSFDETLWDGESMLARIGCEKTVSRMKSKRLSISHETYGSHDTSFHESLLRTEKGIPIYSSKPKILFCDLQLEPYQSETFVFTDTLPGVLSPSYSSIRLKYHYKLIVGTQRVGAAIQLLKIPLRILTLDGLSLESNELSSAHNDSSYENGVKDSPHKDSISLTSIEEDSRYDTNPLDIAIHRIESLTSQRSPHHFNITNTRGRVAKFYIFKTTYRLGEDVIGFINFAEGNVPCVRFTALLQSEEIVADQSLRRTKLELSNLIMSHSKCEEFTLDTKHTQVLLSIPFTVTPSFANDIISLRWRIHFRFVIGSKLESVPIAPQAGNPALEEAIQLTAPKDVNVQTMTWDLPIQVLPTHPSHITKGFQMASIGSLNV